MRHFRDLVAFAQFKKREKHPWRSVTFSKVVGLTKSNTPPWEFSTFFKLYKWYHIVHRLLTRLCIFYKVF